MGHRQGLNMVTPSEDAYMYVDAKVSAGLFAAEIELSTCCVATMKVQDERVV